MSSAYTVTSSTAVSTIPPSASLPRRAAISPLMSALQLLVSRRRFISYRERSITIMEAADGSGNEASQRPSAGM